MLSRLMIVLLACICVGAGAQPRSPLLRIYFVDVEGGAATLIVTPAGESVLIDAGWPGGRDAKRIAYAAKQAGIRAIDHMVSTHWHQDHFAGVPSLAAVMPIRRFYDRGLFDGCGDDQQAMQAYRELVKGASITLRAGEDIKLKTLPGTKPVRLRCLCASGKTTTAPPNSAINPLAAKVVTKPMDDSDNAMSLGFVLSYGGFRFGVFGDITWNIETQLVTPTNKVGHLDLWQVDHHGVNLSNNPVFVRTITPTVCVMNNGTSKGCDPETIATLRSTTSVKAVYQLHASTNRHAANTNPSHIANLTADCKAQPVVAVVAADARSFTVQAGYNAAPERFVVALK